MAVYTEIGDDELRAFIALYDIGEVLSCKGIAEGVENSNYLLTTERGNFILTLYEKRVAPRGPAVFYRADGPSGASGRRLPDPGASRATARRCGELCGRPAAIVTFLNGMWPRRIEPLHCAGLGGALAAAAPRRRALPMVRPNDLGVAGWRRLFQSQRRARRRVAAGPGRRTRATSSLSSKRPGRADLPTGVIHADLFPDNVFFSATATVGADRLLFRLHRFPRLRPGDLPERLVLRAGRQLQCHQGAAAGPPYRAVRPLAAAELAALPLLARGSALRFLLTRLYDWLNQTAGALVRPEGPDSNI